MEYMRLRLILFLLIFPAGIGAQNPPTAFEFDPELNVNVDLNKVVRFEFNTGRERSDEFASSKWKVSAGASFRIKPFRKTFLDLVDSVKQNRYVFGAAYEYSRTPDAGNRIEHRGIFEGTVRYKIPAGMLLTDRNRFELRWVDNGFHVRYRNRLILERRMKLMKLKVSPFVAAEAIWDQRYKHWNVFKYIGGVQVRLIRYTTVDFRYERQHCVVCSTPDTNILGLTLNIFLRRKR